MLVKTLNAKMNKPEINVSKNTRLNSNKTENKKNRYIVFNFST